MAPTPPKAKLRKLLIKFYQKNDPVVLAGGFDINGLVEFTAAQGIDRLNSMLERKYGKIIDVEEEEETAQEQFKRMSFGLTMSTKIQKTEQEYSRKLHAYFQKHDPAMVSNERIEQFEKLVKFAMLNGLPKLSDKLKQKYGAPVDTSGEDPGNQAASPDTDENLDAEAANIGKKGLNPFKLDANRLKNDLELFYNEMEDYEQLEVLDEMTDWVCEIGVEEFDQKMEAIYGTSLNALLQQQNREGHFNQVPAKPQAPSNGQESFREEATQYEEREETSEVIEESTRPFEDMTDDEILEELRNFYMKHDQDNLEKLDAVLGLSRTLGRDALNEKLFELYEEKLQTVRIVKKITRVPLPKQPRQAPATVPGPFKPTPPQAPDDDGFDDSKPPPIPSFGNFQPPPQQFDPSAAMQVVLTPAANVGISRPKQTATYESDEESEVEETELQRIMREKRERIGQGKARVRDGRGNVMEIDITIDVCKIYKLDFTSGICKNCGFSKADHIKRWGKKKIKG